LSASAPYEVLKSVPRGYSVAEERWKVGRHLRKIFWWWSDREMLEVG
jgi:hypothetical protein